MKTLDLVQGSDAWLATRAKHFTASEASAMMGASSKCSRSELLRMKATGTEKEFSAWVQENLLDKGHEIEALARPLAEAFIGEELYPVTAVDDDEYLLASFDGVTIMEDIVWECKSWNEAKAADVRDGRVPEEDVWQVIQQLVVSVADKALYTVSDGTEAKTVHVLYELKEDDEANLLAGWKQFQADLDEYEYVEPEVVPEGKAPESLPALHIELTGMVTASNLVVFKETAMSVIDSVGTDLVTDNDFADAEKAVKWCKDVESRLGAAKDHALSQTASIDELFRALDEIKEEARRKRLSLEKLVKARKESIRVEIVQSGRTALSEHIAGLNKRLGHAYMPDIDANFAGVIKNKRTITSLRDAVDTELARCKIEANAVADRIQMNLETLKEQASEHKVLFADVKTLVLKDNDDLVAIIKSRIAEHKEAEQKRLEAERERIRAEEEAKARQKVEEEAREKQKADDDQRRKDQEEQDRVADEQAKEVESAQPKPEPQAQVEHIHEPDKQQGTGNENMNGVARKLFEWQKRYGVSDAAMKALFAILDEQADYTVIKIPAA